ncbi:MAG: histone deacetylase family protein [Pararhodobacter sp.]
MITIHSEDHRLRDARTELFGGELVQPHERPSRAEIVLRHVQAASLGEIRAPHEFGLDPVLRVHDAEFVDFLSRAWDLWQAAGYKGEAIPTCWPARRMAQRKPDHIDGLLGYYALSTETSFTQGSWQAARASANVALTAAELVQGRARSAFALCRPPGHHAALDMYGGFCFLNNAAIAAQYLRDQGAARVAILDVDFHHGNGTQDVFYTRDDVYFASIHGDPRFAFPHFLGYADETGAGAGEGFNRNYPLPEGTGAGPWFAALDDALARIAGFGAEALVISLGLDAYENDPISGFKLKAEDFTTLGARLARAGLPTLFVLEGGYDIDALGANTVNVLRGFEEG